MSSAYYQVASILEITRGDKGNYVIKDVPLRPPTLPRFVGQENVDFKNDLLRVLGWFDTETFEYLLDIWIDTSFAGEYYLGRLQGTINLEVPVDLPGGGKLVLFIKDGHALWIKVKIKIPFDGEIKKEFELIKW